MEDPNNDESPRIDSKCPVIETMNDIRENGIIDGGSWCNGDTASVTVCRGGNDAFESTRVDGSHAKFIIASLRIEYARYQMNKREYKGHLFDYRGRLKRDVIYDLLDPKTSPTRYQLEILIDAIALLTEYLGRQKNVTIPYQKLYIETPLCVISPTIHRDTLDAIVDWLNSIKKDDEHLFALKAFGKIDSPIAPHTTVSNNTPEEILDDMIDCANVAIQVEKAQVELIKHCSKIARRVAAVCTL